MIESGQKIPSVSIKLATPEGPKDVDPAALFAGKKVVLFSLPGAFTPTCSQKHLPGFVENDAELKQRGIDLVACLSVNDGWVMQAWADAQKVGAKVAMLADGSAAFTRALGIEVDIPGLGVRARRGMIMIDDGVITSIALEAPGKFEVSSVQACLAKLG